MPSDKALFLSITRVSFSQSVRFMGRTQCDGAGQLLREAWTVHGLRMFQLRMHAKVNCAAILMLHML